MHNHNPAAHKEHHGNPDDLEAYITKMEDPARDAWQKPDEVLKTLGLKKGQIICDIGAGPGYFSLRFAKAVGSEGHVYAIDVELKMLEVLQKRMSQAKVSNITRVHADPEDTLLPKKVCDWIVIVDTYHHFPEGVAYLRQLKTKLTPGGRLVNIDFHKKELPLGPPVDHKIAREDFIKDAQTAGFTVIQEPTFLPYQYFIIMKSSDS